MPQLMIPISISQIICKEIKIKVLKHILNSIEEKNFDINIQKLRFSPEKELSKKIKNIAGLRRDTPASEAR